MVSVGIIMLYLEKETKFWAKAAPTEGIRGALTHNNLKLLCPGWRSLVDWAQAYQPKGHQFNSQLGHIPELLARSPVGGEQEATNIVSPFSFPSSPSQNK